MGDKVRHVWHRYCGRLNFWSWNIGFDHLLNSTRIILDYVRGNIPNPSLNLTSVAAAINYIRGGQSGYTNTPPPGYNKTTWDAEMYSYRQAIATIVYQMGQNNSLMCDNTRIEIAVNHLAVASN